MLPGFISTIDCFGQSEFASLLQQTGLRHINQQIKSEFIEYLSHFSHCFDSFISMNSSININTMS